METNQNAGDTANDDEQDDGDSLDSIREHRAAVEQFAEGRTDQLGAAARVLVALADDERPTNADLIAADLPTPGQMESES